MDDRDDTRPSRQLEDHVAIWRIDLTLGAPIEDLLGGLDEHEVARARRFRFRPHYESYVRSHAALRTILADAVGVGPRDVRFDRRCEHCGADHGKPRLTVPPGSGIDFSLSHTNGLALVAASVQRRVGVDVQHTRDDLSFDGIVSLWFDAEEADTLAALPREERVSRFFELWTRREACAKALGLSVAHLLQGRAMEHLVRGAGPVDTEPAFAVRDIRLGPRYAGAVCASRPPWDIVELRLSDAVGRSTARP